ncbi:MAG TPA: helix-turn-helix domain-containing protein [Candidatus Paceibacterota bacterium]
MPTKEKLLSLEDARKILGASERSMYRYIHTGRLKAYKIGYWKIKEQDLREFIKQSSFEPKRLRHRK